MTKAIRSQVVLALVVSLASAVGFAQSGGEATYKAKCAMCHGPAGAADTPTAKMMKVKPVSDPDIKALTVAQISEAVKSGKGKMHPVAGLTDDQIKEVATYYHGLK
jgi:mono/diheme cytochrome c family protein